MNLKKLLLTLPLFVLTIQFYGQQATDSCGIWLNCTEYSFYVNKVYEVEDFKSDTAWLNDQLNLCDKETTKLRESNNNSKMALSSQRDATSTLKKDNERLVIRTMNAEGKTRFWKGVSVTLGVIGLALGVMAFK